MNITPQEAGAALAQIESVVEKTKRAILTAHVADHLIIWGLAWLTGFSAMQFTNWNPGWIWLPIVCAGGALSFLAGWRGSRAVSSPLAWKILAFFGILFLFALIWAVMLHPFNFQNFAAYLATVFMFAYVAGGLWFGPFFTFLGVSVTTAALMAVLLVPAWLNLVMALAGGGGLLASGIYIKSAWK